ncbi:MAG: hypothetical protein ACO1RA_03105 [Planctomycetaceae bacterium]
MNGITAESLSVAQPPRRWLQFCLRTLMFVMLILPIGLGWLAQARSKSQKAWANVEAIHSFGVTWDVWDRHAGPWWQRALGIDLPENVSELSIELHDIDEQKQIQLLTRLKAFPHLKKLDIANPWRSPAALRPLADFQELEELTLWAGQNNLQSESVDEIAKIPRLRSYHEYGADIGWIPNSFAILGSIPSLEEFSYDGLVYECNWSSLKNLRRLHVSSVSLGYSYACGEGANARSLYSNDMIAQIAKLENLESLKLESTDCTDDGLPPLLQLKNLQHLTLESDYITDACLATLAELPALKTLELKGKNISQEAIDQWKARRPDLTITKN